MIQFSNFKSMSLALLAALSFTAAAQDAPRIITVQPLYEGALHNISPNGLWAVGDAVNPANSSFKAYPRLVDVSTRESRELFTQDHALMGLSMAATCVSNDGKTVAGMFSESPGVWKEGKGWSSLPYPKGKYNTGLVSAITPDGRYAVGRVSIDLFQEFPCMWDLETMQLIDLPGMVDSNPRNLDMIEQGGNPAEWDGSEFNVRLNGVSPDGNLIVGTVDFIFPDASWDFLYRRDEAKWYPLGMKYEDGRLRPLDDEIHGVGDCVLSADGKLVGGLCMTVSDASVPFTCSVDDPTAFTLHPEGDGYGVWAIGCDGVIYGSTPTGTPVRNWSAKVGKYWYDWKIVANQIFGIDWMADITKDELGLSGTAMAVSDDNLTILASDYAQNISYIITLPRPLTEICADVDLLGDYRVSPVDGAQFSVLQKIVVDFGREVEVKGEKNSVSLLDADGNPVRNSINLAVQADNSNHVEVIFRNFSLDPGKDYTAVVPAGVISVAGDPSRVNKEIRVNYRGREAGAVKPVSFSPENGASVPRINFSTNPVVVTFNAALAPGENPDIRLYQINGDVEELLFPLNASVNDNRVMIYPASEQRLAEGTDYRIDFGAGSVTDLSGDGPNEAFSITYHGSFVPEIDVTSNTLFSEDFSKGVADMLLYEGDHNTPSDPMAAIGFDVDNTPWMPVLESEESADYSAASHSSYDIPAQSDDWMVTPQLYIPDDKAVLTFKSQSYRADKNDVLKVYVWESDQIVTILTSSIIDKIRYNGNLVYNEVQTPGESEELLSGDWKVNSIPLSEYAGKNIYIAFVNDNRNQSIVFVDDIKVSRDMVAVLSVNTPQTMVDEDKTVVKGRFVVMKEEGISGYKITLSDADGNLLGSIDSNESMKYGETGAFSFSNPVSLDKCEVNSFVVTFTSGGETLVLKHDIRNLLFDTTKRLVLEETTGTTCQFCPQGILGIEFLQDLFGDIFIPVAIHSYKGDKFGGAELNAYSAFLSHSGAPSGCINRGPVSSPMYFDMKDYTFTSPDGLTWLNQADEAMSELALADIDILGAEIDEVNNKVSVDATVKSAINLHDASVNVFGVVMEDGLPGFQTNGMFNTEAQGLGEWGKGGAYAKQTVPWLYDDVVRGTSVIESAGIYSGFNGRGGYIPAEVEAGQPVDFTFEFNLPSGIKDLTKTKVCLMLIDANTGEFINAALSGYAAMGVGAVGGMEPQVADVYDLAGRLVLRSASIESLDRLEKGIYIRAGRKFVVH